MLFKLDDKKSTRIDNIPNDLLRRDAVVCQISCNIFGKFFEITRVPTEWKYVKVISIFKAVARRLVTKYHQILLLCTTGKVLK